MAESLELQTGLGSATAQATPLVDPVDLAGGRLELDLKKRKNTPLLPSQISVYARYNIIIFKTHLFGTLRCASKHPEKPPRKKRKD